MISVVIPLYNKECQIQKTLQSVLAQTYTDFEIIIVNDGSTDRSVERVLEISDPRIHLITQPNAGVSAARNRGISEAHGKYIALLDGDDEWKPDYLSTQASLIELYQECDVFTTDYEQHTTDGKVNNTTINNLPFTGSDGILSNYFQVASTSHPPICSISIVATRAALLSIGGFPEGIRSGEDLLTWARLAARYKIAYSRRPLAIFNVEGYELSDRPKRLPATDDVVGRSLRDLAREFNPPYIHHYIAHWHKMRSSIYMRLGMRRASISEALKGLRSNPLNVKLYAYIAINCLPGFLKPF